MDAVLKKPQSHRLRTGRISEPNQIYLLSTVCNNREPLFSDITLGRIVVRSLRHHHEHGYVSSLAFVCDAGSPALAGPAFSRYRPAPPDEVSQKLYRQRD